MPLFAQIVALLHLFIETAYKNNKVLIRMTKITQNAFFCALCIPLLAEVKTEQTTSKDWLAMIDWQNRFPASITHNPSSGSYGKARLGFELIKKDDQGVTDFEYYRYNNVFKGSIAGTDTSFGDTTDLMLTGFRQWQWNPDCAVQLIYAAELAAEDSLSLTDGFRWGLGTAARWRPAADTDLALGILIQDRFENSILPIPYVKMIWTPCRYAEVEFRATGLQNGFIIRGFLTEDKATTVDLVVAYETLTFQLKEVSYGTRAVAIGDVVTRIGITQFLESTGTWFIRFSGEYINFSRYTFNHDGETQGVFQTSPAWATNLRIGARF